MKTISREAECSLEIKRSRFIGRSFKCATADEALAIVKRIQETWRDATHHCWAYRVGTTGEQARYDNAGEPHGTAGPPILDALKNAGVTNALIVVTRYYGGTKLGAGGLVRAYGEAAKRALEASGLTELRQMKEIRAPLPYNLLSPLESYMAREGFEIAARDFGEHVVITLRVPSDREADFRSFYTALVGGKLAYIVLGERTG
ncbi:MAG: YigZ family protein [Candidatus Aminicenantes bacterium]|nr:YigZ family protein [Candidatus Aminicenantes bacterium]